jgi:multimeric flavodoxin WrbA
LILPKNILKLFFGGKQSVMKEKPELLPFDKNPADYDVLFIGTPVWAWNMSAPIRSFLSSTKLTGKKVALFCCNGGQKGKTFVEMEQLLVGNTLVGGEIDFREPLKHDKEADAKRAGEWAKSIVDSLG